MEDVFSQLKERVGKDRMNLLDRLYKEFKSAKKTDELNEIREQLIENFRVFVERRNFFGESLRGPQAEAGTYRLILTAGGKSYTRYLAIRNDPLLKD